MAKKINLYDFEEYARNNPYQHHNHIEMVRVDESGCRVKVVLAHESMNLHGYIHGGLMYSMADVVCGIHSRIHGGRYVTQSSHINFLRNAKDAAEIYCDTQLVRRGRTIVVVRFQVKDDRDRLLADGVIDMIHVGE